MPTGWNDAEGRMETLQERYQREEAGMARRLEQVADTAPKREYPIANLIRLRELAAAVTQGLEAVSREFTMRVPAEPERDADLVISAAADEIERLRAELAAIKGQEPYRWLDWEGGSEAFVTDSEASSYSPIGEKPFPLYALPVADKDAERPKLCLELTGAEIKDLAECAGFVLVNQDYSDECETEISLVECAATGVVNDDGTAEHYRYVAYFSEYPEEGCHPLGPQVEAAMAKGA